MTAFDWTTDQLRAIRSPKKRVLVSASAGAGKTGVLVERYLWLVTREEDPVRPDRILAVTFTEAAAAEMRRRIREGLRAWAEEAPRDQQRRREVLSVDRAPISTLHSFCRTLLLQEYQTLGLDPAFRVLGEEEATLLRREAVGLALERSYALDGEAGQAFRGLVSRSADPQLDEALGNFVIGVWSFLTSLPEPKKWSDDVLETHRRAASGASLYELPLFDAWHAGVLRQLGDAAGAYRLAAELAETDPPMARAYANELRARAAACEAWARQLEAGEDPRDIVGDMEALCERRMKDHAKDADERLKEVVQDLYGSEGAKNYLVRLRRSWLGLGAAEMTAMLGRAAPDMEALLGLVDRFNEAYAAEKERRGALDFADLERRCRELLVRRAGGPHARPLYDHILVDEYQDINRIQDEIIERAGGGEAHLFMVGDLKQSIYRFRQAEPRVFDDRKRECAAGNDTELIRLRENHRSRGEIIAGINDLLRSIMCDRRGGVAYDGTEALIAKAKYPERRDGEPAVEMLLFEKIQSRDLDEDAPESIAEWASREREAYGVADRLLTLLGRKESPPLWIWDAKRSKEREIRPRDIVVLLRSIRGVASQFEAVFRARGLECAAAPATGFLAQREIREMTAILRALHNPLDDIALAATLRSFAFGLRVEDLAAVRAALPREPFHAALRECAKKGGPCTERAAAACARLERWRTEARLRTLPDLLSLLYEETIAPVFVAALPDGELRRANLLRLFDLARLLHRGERRGLAGFLDFLARMDEEEIEPTAVASPESGPDVVSIQSIHQAKGIEYPVVVVAALGGKFSTKDEQATFPLARAAGAGAPLVDIARRIRVPTLACLAAADEIHEHGISEEMRILYVAMTRARERLILTGTPNAGRGFLDRMRAAARLPAGPVPPFWIASAHSMLDWLAPAVARHPDGAALRGGEPLIGPVETQGRLACRVYTAEEMATWQPRDERDPDVRALIERIASLQEIEAPPASPEAMSHVARAAWVYPHSTDARRPAKAGVSELKRPFDRAAVRDLPEAPGPGHFESAADAFHRVPTFMMEGERSAGALDHGRATHIVLQRIDLTGPLDESGLAGQIDRLVDADLIDAASAKRVRLDRLAAFFAGPYGRRLARDPSRVHREVPVNLAVTPEAWECWQRGEWVPPEQGSGDFVHVQGIVDCLVEEDEGLLLLDYKTDHVSGERLEERAVSYRPQVMAYAAALRALLSRPVTEAALYFLEEGVARPVAPLPR